MLPSGIADGIPRIIINIRLSNARILIVDILFGDCSSAANEKLASPLKFMWETTIPRFVTRRRSIFHTFLATTAMDEQRIHSIQPPVA